MSKKPQTKTEKAEEVFDEALWMCFYDKGCYEMNQEFQYSADEWGIMWSKIFDYCSDKQIKIISKAFDDITKT
jgi:hypothetical protein